MPCASRFLGGGGPVALRFPRSFFRRTKCSPPVRDAELDVRGFWGLVLLDQMQTSSSDMAVFTAWAAASVSSSGGGDRLGELTRRLGDPNLPSNDIPTSLVGGGLWG